MKLLPRAVGLCVLFAATACGGSSSSPTPFTISVTAPSTSVLLGRTAQLAVTFSDNKVRSGTWTSDNTGILTVDSTTGLVSGVGAGTANIAFETGGQRASLGLRGLSNVAGVFQGSYTVTSCAHEGQAAAANFCGSFPTGTELQYTFVLTQNGDTVGGHFFLGAVEFGPDFSSTLATNGSFTASGRSIDTGSLTIDATWALVSAVAQGLTGTVETIWRDVAATGEASLNGRISTTAKLQRAPSPAGDRSPLSNSTDEIMRRFSAR